MRLANSEEKIRQMNFHFQTKFDILQNFISVIIQYLLASTTTHYTSQQPSTEEGNQVHDNQME